MADTVEATHRNLIAILRANIPDVQSPARADFIRVEAPFMGLTYTPASQATQSSSGTAITSAVGSSSLSGYSSFPSPSIPTYPIISVVLRSFQADRDFYTIGEVANPLVGTPRANWYSMTFQIDIWVQRGDNFVVGAQTLSDMFLLTYLNDQVTTAIEQFGKAAAGGYGWTDIRASGYQEHPFDEKTQLFRRTVLCYILTGRAKP